MDKEKEEKRVWSGSWVLRNSRRPPNELFSSLPIYFCSLFNRPPPAMIHLFSSTVPVSLPTRKIPKILFLRCNSSDPPSGASRRRPILRIGQIKSRSGTSKRPTVEGNSNMLTHNKTPYSAAFTSTSFIFESEIS